MFLLRIAISLAKAIRVTSEAAAPIGSIVNRASMKTKRRLLREAFSIKTESLSSAFKGGLACGSLSYSQ